MDEEKQKQIESTIMAAFDRWSMRNNEKYLQEQRAPGRQREESVERARQDGLFLTKRVFAPGFDRFIVLILLSNPVVRNQARVMLKSALVSIIKEAGAKTEEVIKKSPETSSPTLEYVGSTDQYVARRQFQRYRHEDFKEMIFTIADDARDNKVIADDRISPFSTVFAPIALPQNEETQEAEAYLELDRVASMSNTDALKRIMLDSMLRLVAPEYVQGLLGFQKDCLGLLNEIGAHGETAGILLKEFSKFSLSLGVFYAHFQSILGVYWYRRQKPEKKKELMARGFPLRYSRNDAERIAPLLVNLMGSEERACQVMVEGATCLFEYSLSESHDYLVDECLSMMGLSKQYSATIAENAAVLHRTKNNYGRMLHYANRANGLSMEAKDVYLACLTIRDRAEAQWYMGMQKESVNSLEQSEKVALESLRGKQLFGVYFNLATGCRRMRNENLEFKYLRKALELANHTDNVSSVLYVNSRLGEILSRR